jgi:hypothetical protein
VKYDAVVSVLRLLGQPPYHGKGGGVRGEYRYSTGTDTELLATVVKVLMSVGTAK